MGYRNYSTANGLIVDPSGNGDFKTISAALTAAVSGDTVFIRPSTYSENPALVAGVNLAAYNTTGSNSRGNVIINGKCTFSSAGTVSISGICLQTNSDYCLEVTGSAASIVNLDNCFINVLNNTAIHFTSSSASSFITLNQCNGDIQTTGIALYTFTGAGELYFNGCLFSNPGVSLTANSSSGTGQVIYWYSYISNASTCSSSGSIYAYHATLSMAGNQVALTTSGTATSGLFLCMLASNTSSALSIGTGTTVALHNCFISSANANAITGIGTLQFSELTFNSNATISSGLTISNSSMSTWISGAGVGTSGQVWTSNGATNPPTFQTASSGAVVQQIRATSTTPTTTSTLLAPTAGTTPTTSNTVQLLSAVLTPTNSAHILKFDFSIPWALGVEAGSLGLFIFAGTTLIQSFVYSAPTITEYETAAGFCYATAGTTSATTYALYYAASSVAVYILQNSSSMTFYNSTTAANFTVTEYTA